MKPSTNSFLKLKDYRPNVIGNLNEAEVEEKMITSQSKSKTGNITSGRQTKFGSSTKSFIQMEAAFGQ